MHKMPGLEKKRLSFGARLEASSRPYHQAQPISYLERSALAGFNVPLTAELNFLGRVAYF